MKKSVYSLQSWGGSYPFELEILMDVNRDLTDNDRYNLQICTGKLKEAILEETIKLDPKSKINSDNEKAQIIELFGDRVIYVEEIPNGYCSSYCCKHLPWFIITTIKGKIKIGWRKRVINIDWSDSIITESAESLFPKEDVTKFDKCIHAWGYEKAKEYLNILLN